MPARLHHVVMRSHSAQTFVAFLTEVVGLEVQFQMRVPREVLQKTLGWPPSEGDDVTALDTGIPGVDLFFCTMGGVPMEFMGAYAPEANSGSSEATNS
ncbi:hypothetical protein [Mycolicibacterium gadium]|uniref:Glyoxalase n=1 Tax=Mycolicibacterium gadium TaxID=1794 RepID=A0ABT6GPW0_MYCGU|nr:hypothetical protein [Mycolicibacterium gadium]MDG5483923.1 hypothetical protein [Mycolicibacterium gadium]